MNKKHITSTGDSTFDRMSKLSNLVIDANSIAVTALSDISETGGAIGILARIALNRMKDKMEEAAAV